MTISEPSSIYACGPPLIKCQTPIRDITSTSPEAAPISAINPVPIPSTDTVPNETPRKWEPEEGFWGSIFVTCVPLLLSALEGSITNTALPTISKDLNLGTKFSWVATAFLLASTILLPLYGQVADLWGRKYPMMVAVFVFGIGSAICGWAQQGEILIFGRVIQGLGSGGIDIFAELVFCDLVPLRKRGSYMAIKHVVFAVGMSLGPVLGGIFAEWNWRWCFWVNLPLCGIAIAAIAFWLRLSSGSHHGETPILSRLRKIDIIGTFLLTGSVIFTLVALSTGGSPHPWVSPLILAPLIIGIIGLICVPFYEFSKFCHNPILPRHIFANRTSVSAFTLTAIHGFLTYGVQFYLPPFFQAVLGSSPTKSGIQVLPTCLVIVVLAAVGGPLLSYTGRYRPIHQGGFAAMTIGFGLFTLLSADAKPPQWVTFQLLVAAGSGIVVSTMLPAVLVELPDRASAAAAGSWAFLRGLGSLFGVAIPGALFNARFAALMSTIDSEVARSLLIDGQAYQRASADFLKKFPYEVQKQIIRVFTDGLRAVWICFLVLAGVGFVITFLERQVKLRKELETDFGLAGKKESAAGTNQPMVESDASPC